MADGGAQGRPIGAVAKRGVQAAAKPPKPKVKKKRAKKKSPVDKQARADQRTLAIWKDYARARDALLDATGATALGDAELRVHGARDRHEARLRAARRGPDRPSKAPKETRSRSVRTVSGGSPGLGRRR